MAEHKSWWSSRGSRFAAVVDTVLALWGGLLVLQDHTRVEFWLFSGLFLVLATQEWYAYFRKDHA